MRTHHHHTGFGRRVTALACFTAMSFSAGAADTAPASPAPDLDAAKTALTAFAQCDASFFTLLGQKPQLFGSGVEVAMNGTVAAPTVADPRSEKGHRQSFARPIDVAGLRLLAWRNEVSYDATIGAFLWWGFDVEGTPDKAADALNRLLQPSERVVKTGAEWARAENRRIGDPIDAWRRGGQSGSVTQKGTVERVLLIEADEAPGRTKVSCALQGSVTPPLLERVRPDLPPSLQQ
jgi:hypothetical protein